MRCAAIFSNQFRVAYTYGENVDKVIVMNPTKGTLKIRKGTQMAEFHARPDDAYVVKTLNGDVATQCVDKQTVKVDATGTLEQQNGTRDKRFGTKEGFGKRR